MKVFVYHSRSGEFHVYGPCNNKAERKVAAKKLCKHLENIGRMPEDDRLAEFGYDKRVLDSVDTMVHVLNDWRFDCGTGDIVKVE